MHGVQSRPLKFKEDQTIGACGNLKGTRNGEKSRITE